MWQLCKAEASTLVFIYFWLCATYNKIVYMYLLWILLWNFEPSETCHSTLFLCHMITFVISKIIYFIFILSQYIYICKSVINNYRFENMYAIFIIWVHCYIRLLYSGILVEKKLQRTLVRFSKKKILVLLCACNFHSIWMNIGNFRQKIQVLHWKKTCHNKFAKPIMHEKY